MPAAAAAADVAVAAAAAALRRRDVYTRAICARAALMRFFIVVDGGRGGAGADRDGERGWGRGEKKVGGGVAGGSSRENLHAMVEAVSHHDAPVAVDGNAAIRAVELSVAW
jgi:hypothetical protein